MLQYCYDWSMIYIKDYLFKCMYVLLEKGPIATTTMDMDKIFEPYIQSI